MAQDSEDEVWKQILANANQLTFPEWDFEEAFPEWDFGEAFPEDKESEKITEDKEKVDENFCSCDNRQEVKQQIANDVFYVCSKSKGGCGREIKK